MRARWIRRRRPVPDGTAVALRGHRRGDGPRTTAAHPHPPASRRAACCKEMTMSTMYARATIKVKANNTVSVQTRTKAVAAGLSTTQFASLASNAKALSDQSTTLDKAETVAKTRVPGSAAARNVQRSAL